MLRTILSQGLRRRRGIRYSLGEWSDPIRSWCARDTLLERFISKPKHFIQLQAGFCTSLENAFCDRMEPALLSIDIKHKDYILLSWSDEKSSRFHLHHLRAWCSCAACQSTCGQRIVNSADLNAEFVIEDISVRGSTLNIVWGPKQHKSTYTWRWLRDNCYENDSLEAHSKSMTPTVTRQDFPMKTVDYTYVMGSDRGVFELLHNVVEYGCCVVKETPTKAGEVRKIAKRIAPISHSFLYGEIFDVVSEDEPINIAYTSRALKHHVDLSYYESPPGVQLLHALEFDASISGGISTFVDVFAATKELQILHPQHFDTLCRVPATFKKYHLDRSNPAVMEFQRPHIHTNHRGEIIAVHWSPPFEGPLRVPFDDVLPYYAAYKVLHDIIENPGHRKEYRLQEGDTIVFNQRRMLHGRTYFEANIESTKRHLQGSYINIDDALCRYNALRITLGLETASYNRRVANGNFA